MMKMQWYEWLLFVLPFGYIYGLKYYLKPELERLMSFRFTLAMMLIPLWYVLIDAFSLLLYGFSLKTFCIFIAAFLLGLDLYSYVLTLHEFKLKPYLYQATNLIFIYLSSTLFGLMCTRIFSYFVH